MLQSIRRQNTIDLVWQLFRTDFKLRYNDSALGFLWVLMKPFSIFLIMYFVLSRVFPSNEPNFALYLLIGNVFITFWNDGTSMGMDSLLSRASLITKVNFPRYIVLISSTAIAVVNFLINLIIVSIFAVYSGIVPGIQYILWFFFCSFILYLIIIVTSMFLSIIYVRFRDMKQIWELFNQLLFWATPIFYSFDALIKQSELMNVLLTKLNPLSILLISSRNALLKSDVILQRNVAILFVVTLVVFGIGYIFYKGQIKKIAEYF